jgi:hypothetical protein
VTHASGAFCNQTDYALPLIGIWEEICMWKSETVASLGQTGAGYWRITREKKMMVITNG